MRHATCNTNMIQNSGCNTHNEIGCNGQQCNMQQADNRQHAMLQHVASTCDMQRCSNLQRATRNMDRMQRTTRTRDRMQRETALQRTALQHAKQTSCNGPHAMLQRKTAFDVHIYMHPAQALRWGAAHCRALPAATYTDCHNHPKQCRVRGGVRSTS